MFSLGIAIAAGVLSAVLFILASPSYGMWPLGLLAVAPFYYLRLVSRKPVTVLAPIIFVAAFVLYNGKWYFTSGAVNPILAALGCLILF
jgi:hypothetical protein